MRNVSNFVAIQILEAQLYINIQKIRKLFKNEPFELGTFSNFNEFEAGNLMLHFSSQMYISELFNHIRIYSKSSIN